MGAAVLRRSELPGLARDSLRRLQAADGAFVAAGLTFYAAIAVVPLMLSALWIAGLLIGESRVLDLATRTLEYAPAELGLRRALTAIRDVGVGLGVASFVAGLIPATSYGEGLVRAFARLAPECDGPSKSLRGRLSSAVLLATFPVFTVAGLFAVAAVEGAIGGGVGGAVVGVYLAFLFGWASVGVLVTIMYRVFGPVRLSAPALAWASAATGSFLSGMTLGWLPVLRFGIEVGGAYGGSRDLGSAVLFVVYLYLVQYVLLSGYVLAVEIDARRDGSGTAPSHPTEA